ncbi:MAG: hypothetical protein IPM75_08660 [Candidatus Competibacteraceae bacterium]|nr:hypothetical protein [Candidatus Competibacteraceae bacterium]
MQDQLFQRDLPVVRQALDIPVRVALLKGRGNYLCHYRWQATEDSGRLEFARAGRRAEPHSRLGAAHPSRRYRRGQRGPEASMIWPRVTSTVDNCLGQDCPQLADCFLAKARREALAADVLVINHHLFCADMAMKETGFAELLPGAEAIILDEAHQLPEVASQFFGKSLSSRQLLELARDTVVEQSREARDFAACASAPTGWTRRWRRCVKPGCGGAARAVARGRRATRRAGKPRRAGCRARWVAPGVARGGPARQGLEKLLPARRGFGPTAGPC